MLNMKMLVYCFELYQLSLIRSKLMMFVVLLGYTALHHAAVSHHRRPSDEVIMALLQNGANINAKVSY